MTCRSDLPAGVAVAAKALKHAMETARESRWVFLAAGGMATTASQWLILVVLARTGSPEQVGVFGLLAAWLAPLFTFGGLQLRALMASEHNLHGRLEGYASIRKLGFVVAALLLVIPITFDRNLSHYWWIVLAASVPRFAELAADFSYGIGHRARQFRAIGRSQLLRNTAFLSVFCALWLSLRDLTIAFAGAGLAAILVVVCCDLPATRSAFAGRGRNSGSRGMRRIEEAGPILRHALPLAAVACLNAGVIAIPRIVLGQQGSLADLATFSCLLSLFLFPTLIASAYATSLAPDFADVIASGNPARISPLVRRASLKIVLISLTTCASLVPMGNELLRFLFGPRYAVDSETLVATGLFVTLWASCSVMGTAATSLRWTGLQLAAFGASLLGSSAIGMHLIPARGLPGAAWSMLSAGAILATFYAAAFALRLSKPAVSRLPFAMPSGANGRPLAQGGAQEQLSQAGLDAAATNATRSGIPSRAPAPRVLHVTSALNAGGVELWLQRLLRHSEFGDYRVGILSLGSELGILAPSFESEGIRVWQLAVSRNPIAFVLTTAEAIRESGPWDVVHSHVNRRSAFVLLGAMLAGVRVRVSHGHHVFGTGPLLTAFPSRVYGWLCRVLLHYVATDRLACSHESGVSLFGKRGNANPGFVVMPCGVEISQCLENNSEIRSRTEFGIPESALVIAHAGRFVPEKNHRFLLAVAAHALELAPSLHFLLLGDGPVRQEMEERAAQLGISANVTFAGHREPVMPILSGCADAFFFPSVSEGLGVALIEAQLAGLPCLIAEHLPSEANLFPESNRSFSLRESPRDVASLLVALVGFRHRPDLASRFSSLKGTPFELECNVRMLQTLYANALHAPGESTWK